VFTPGKAAVVAACMLAMVTVAGLSPGETDAAYGRWESRLAALRPQEPMAYFELAEEIADEAADDVDRQLARRLFGLAAALDPAHLGCGACLALAKLATDGTSRRRIEALAALINRGDVAATDPAFSATRPSPAAAVAVSEAVSLLRRGYGSRATLLMETPGAAELLEAHSALLPGGARRFLEDCKLYRTGAQKPPLTDAEFNTLLRLEQLILSSVVDRPASWTPELIAVVDRPLLEVDPDNLAAELGVDPARPLYRDGQWVPAGD
jgi:hypothetical protein